MLTPALSSKTISPTSANPVPPGIGPPDQTALTALWERALATMTTESGVDAAKLASKCHGFTPGDVDLAAQRAAAEAFARARATGKAAVVTNEDLTAATNRTKASITPEMLSAYQAEVSMFERV